MKAPTGIGILGAGDISGIYLKNCTRLAGLRVVACANRRVERARMVAKRFGIPKACGIPELLVDSEVEIVVNLTVPQVHGEIALAALNSNKSVYNEKPLALTREEGLKLLQVADSKGLRIGCAPDTFLGAGLQSCRKLLDEGAIGEPVAATGLMLNPGPENEIPPAPDPSFYYQAGGGPMFDMGPYYLTALATLLGPVRRVTASARITYPRRASGSDSVHEAGFEVRTPTHIAGIMEFDGGPIGTLVTSFDTLASDAPYLEIYGSKGTLRLPDPNTFGGPISIRHSPSGEWFDVPLTHSHREDSRGLGVAEMADAIRSDRAHRASGDLAYHVLDVMQSFLEASENGRHIEVHSTCDRPAPLSAGPANYAA